MMGLFEHFPYTNFHDLNLDWLLEFVKEAKGLLNTFAERLEGVEQQEEILAAAQLEQREAFERLAEVVTALFGDVEAVRSVPSGGTAGQVLTADGADGYGWETPPEPGWYVVVKSAVGGNGVAGEAAAGSFSSPRSVSAMVGSAEFTPFNFEEV